MAKATGLIFFTVRRRFSPRGAFWHTTIHAFLMYLPVSSFVYHSSLLTAKSVDFVVGILSQQKSPVFISFTIKQQIFNPQ